MYLNIEMTIINSIHRGWFMRQPVYVFKFHGLHRPSKKLCYKFIITYAVLVNFSLPIYFFSTRFSL